jgi:hypothetical protein
MAKNKISILTLGLNLINYIIYIMSQVGNCSLCDSPGTNKRNCPLNPKATKPNYTSHPKAREKLGAVAALSRRSPPPAKHTTSAQHTRLNQDFALAHMNKTVLCFMFEKAHNRWKKVKDDRGEYFKIIGFTDDDEYDLDFQPPTPGAMLYPNPPLSCTPKKYIVLHQEGELYPIVIQKNGEILRGDYCFFV